MHHHAVGSGASWAAVAGAAAVCGTALAGAVAAAGVVGPTLLVGACAECEHPALSIVATVAALVLLIGRERGWAEGLRLTRRRGRWPPVANVERNRIERRDPRLDFFPVCTNDAPVGGL
jgi:hypothetical protein